MKRYEESLEQINKVIERIQNREGDQSSYYYHKVRILRRLNRSKDAMAMIDELTEKYGNKDVFREKFDMIIGIDLGTTNSLVACSRIF